MAKPQHIIDTLIAERAPRLTRAWFWSLARPLVYGALGYGPARRMADDIASLGGKATMDYASRALDLTVKVGGAGHVPASGRVVIICNHPTGLADGVAVFDALKTARPDLMFFANADAHRVNPRLSSIFIPVEWVEAKRTRDRTRLTLQEANRALEGDRALIVFASGRISVRNAAGLMEDPPWAPTALSLARKHGAPVLPAHVSGPFSTLFNLFHRFSPELRDITLFHELLNKRRKTFTLTFGPLIPPEQLEGDAGEITDRLKAYVERRLADAPDAPFA